YMRSFFIVYALFFFFSSRRRHTRSKRDWSSDVCSSDLNHGKFISDSAGHTEELATLDGDGVLALFNKLSNYFVNNEVIGTKVAKVKPELYNVIIDIPQTTVEKHSSANIDENTIVKFKGFEIQEVPDAQFAEGETAYAYVKDIGKAFTGINTARTIESEDFDGVALQGAGKAGEF